jgi:hypothetical protein
MKTVPDFAPTFCLPNLYTWRDAWRSRTRSCIVPIEAPGIVAYLGPRSEKFSTLDNECNGGPPACKAGYGAIHSSIVGVLLLKSGFFEFKEIDKKNRVPHVFALRELETFAFVGCMN